MLGLAEQVHRAKLSIDRLIGDEQRGRLRRDRCRRARQLTLRFGDIGIARSHSSTGEMVSVPRAMAATA